MKHACTVLMLVCGGIAAACPAPESPAAEVLITAYDGPWRIAAALQGVAHRAAFADVYLVAPGTTFRADLSEADAMHLGCRYRVEDPEQIAGLVDLLARSGVRQAPLSKFGFDDPAARRRGEPAPANANPYDARIVVRFHEYATTYLSLVLGPDYIDRPASGEFILVDGKASRSLPVEAPHGIERTLRAWAAQHAQLAPKACPG